MRTSVHQTQRRFSCEVCRKHKSRCQRLYPNDPKCSRCTLLGVECTTGQQKKVGRPRRAATSGKESITSPLATERPQPARLGGTFSSNHVTGSPESAAFLGTSNELGWDCDIFPPAPTLAPEVVAHPDDAFPSVSGFVESLDLLFQAPDGGIRSWDAPNDHVETCSSSTTHPIFGATTSTSDWLNTPPTTTAASSPPDSIYPQTDTPMKSISGLFAVDDIAASEAIAKLSEMNLNLHVRLAAAETNKATLNFNALVLRESPLYIDKQTLAEFTLSVSQEFMLILVRLRASSATRGLLHARQPTRSAYSEVLPLSAAMDGFSYEDPMRQQSGTSKPSASFVHQGSQYTGRSIPSSDHFAASEPLLAPIALTITSVFIQLICLYEVTLKHLAARVERIVIDPIAPIPGLTFGGLPLASPCTQGMFFAQLAVHSLERIERSLGIAMVPEGGEAGLLSADQMHVLWSQLETNVNNTDSPGVARPANVRRSFEKLEKVFKQLSLS